MVEEMQVLNTSKGKPGSKKWVIGIGIAQNCVFLIFCALLYQFFLIQFVNEGFAFLGEFGFFVAEALVFPFINILLKKYYVLLGNILGIVVYFLVFIPFSMIFGG